MANSDQQQRDSDVITYETFTGVRNDVDPERFSPSDLYSAVNVDIDKSGRLARRDGYTNVAAGDTHSLWADNITALFVQGTELKQLLADYSSVVVKTGVTPGAFMRYTKVSGRVYMSNGVDTAVFENGTVRTWGIVPPPLPAVTATVGNMPAGTYQYTCTYFRGDGQESGATLSGVITLPANSGMSVVVQPSIDPGVVSKALYLSPPDGDMQYLAALVANNTGAFLYQNDTSELALPLATQFLCPAPAGQLSVYYRGRLFVASGSVLYPSSAFSYELFDLREYIDLDGRITMMAAIEDRDANGENSGLFIGTDQNTGVLIGSDPREFKYVPKVNYGAIIGAIDYVDGSLFGDNSLGARLLPMWQSSEGLCVGLPNMDIRNLTRTKYGYAVGSTGAALFQPGPNKFIAITN